MIVDKIADLLTLAVLRDTTDSRDLCVGDCIVITAADSDTVGVVKQVKEAANDATCLVLGTKQGDVEVVTTPQTYVHLIQTAEARKALLKLRQHHEYERELKDVPKKVHSPEEDARPKFGPVTNSEKSELPTSKISLSLRKSK